MVAAPDILLPPPLVVLVVLVVAMMKIPHKGVSQKPFAVPDLGISPCAGLEIRCGTSSHLAW